MDLTTATPAEIDGEIDRIGAELVRLMFDGDMARERIAKIDAVEPGSYASFSPRMSAEARAKHVATIEATGREMSALNQLAKPLEAAYAANPWTRYWLVNNSNGHVHTNTRCRTCYDTTRFVWLTEQSGMDRDGIVDLAGELSCAECFPGLPAEIMNKKTRIEDPAKRKTRLEREAAKAERDAKKLAKALLPDCSDLRFTVNGHIERLATETAAAQWVVKHMGEHKVYGYRFDPAAVETVLGALATKHGVTVDAEREAIAAKYLAWVKREEREAAKTRVSLGL